MNPGALLNTKFIFGFSVYTLQKGLLRNMRSPEGSTCRQHALQNICYSWNAVIAKRVVLSNTYAFLPVVRGQ